MLSVAQKQEGNLSVADYQWPSEDAAFKLKKDYEIRSPGKEKNSSLYLQLFFHDCAPPKSLRFEKENEDDDLFK